MSEKTISYKEYENLDDELLAIHYDNEFLKPYGFSILTVDEIEVDSIYAGTCRNADLALWTGEKFCYLRSKFGDEYRECLNHIDLEENGFLDAFIPIAKVEDVPAKIKEKLFENN